MASLLAVIALLSGLLLGGCGGGDDEPPVMASVAVHPADAEVAEGGATELTVRGAGTPPLQYQWRRNGVELPGATSERLALPPATACHSGDEFDVMVSNEAGSDLSRAATLTVRPAPGAAPKREADPAAISGPEAGPVQPPCAAEAVAQGSADAIPTPADGPADTAAAPAEGSGAGDAGPAAAAADEAAADPEGGSAAAPGAPGEAESGDAGDAAAADTRVAPFAATPPRIVTAPRSVLANPGQAVSFRVVARGTAPLRYQWRRNNVDIPGATRASYTTPRLTLSFNRSTYRVVVRNAAGTRLSAAALLTVTERPIAPILTVQPAPLRVPIGQAAVFRVQALGSTPSYQWFRDGRRIPGATGAVYRLARPAPTDSGAQFRVRVSNRIGTVVSLPATLTVGAAIAPRIALQPESVTARSGATVAFLVVATGTPPFRYEWRRNGVPVPGATAARLAVQASAANRGAVYSVRVRNSAGSRLSRGALLSVADTVAGPLLQRNNCLACHAYDRKVIGPSFLDIAARYAGQPRKAYLVQRILGGGGGVWGPVPMPANPQVTPAEAGAIAGWLLAGAPPAAGPPSVARQPADVQVAPGGFATFGVSARGVAPLGYQWRRNGAVVLGATGPNYTTEALAAADDGTRITVTVRNAQGSVTSRTALLRVIDPAPYPYPY